MLYNFLNPIRQLFDLDDIFNIEDTSSVDDGNDNVVLKTF